MNTHSKNSQGALKYCHTSLPGKQLTALHQVRIHDNQQEFFWIPEKQQMMAKSLYSYLKISLTESCLSKSRLYLVLTYLALRASSKAFDGSGNRWTMRTLCSVARHMSFLCFQLPKIQHTRKPRMTWLVFWTAASCSCVPNHRKFHWKSNTSTETD